MGDHRIGSNVPEITRVFTALHDKGFDVPPNIYSVKEGVRILRALLEGGVGEKRSSALPCEWSWISTNLQI